MSTHVPLYTVTWADTRIRKVVVEVMVSYDAAHARVVELTDWGFHAVAGEQGIDIHK